MDVETARRLIASYATGGGVSAEELEAACLVAGRDLAWVSALKAEFGLAGPPEDTCLVFQSRVAEYCECPESQRPVRMSSLRSHLADCSSCREVYELMPPTWIESAASHPPSAVRTFRLASPIRLRIGARGELTQVGSLPVPAHPESVEQEMCAPGAATPGLALIEWYLPLSDVGLEARLSVHPEGDDKVAFSLRVGPHAAGAPPAKVEVRSTAGKQLLHIGRVVDSIRSPIVLPEGSYELLLRDAAGQEYVIGLDLLDADDEDLRREAATR